MKADARITMGQEHAKLDALKNPDKYLIVNGLYVLKPRSKKFKGYEGVEAEHAEVLKRKPSKRNISKKSASKSVARKARDLLVKPEHCEECGVATTDLEAHHVIPHAELKKTNAHLDVNNHIFRWLCPTCHLAKHENEPVARLMKKRLAEK